MPRNPLPIPLYPKVIGPFSQAVAAGGFVFLSGQVPYDREADDIVSGDSSTQIRQAMRNIQGILAELGADLGDLVKVTLFIRDYAEYGQISSAYGEFFSDSYPARTLVTVAELPPRVNVIVDAIAYVGD